MEGRNAGANYIMPRVPFAHPFLSIRQVFRHTTQGSVGKLARTSVSTISTGTLPRPATNQVLFHPYMTVSIIIMENG